MFKASKKSLCWFAGLTLTGVAVAIYAFVGFQGGSEDDRSEPTETTQAPLVIREEVRDVVKLTQAPGNEWALIDAVSNLGATLTADEAAQIAESLRSAQDGGEAVKMSAVDWNSLLNLLRTNGYAEPELLELLAAVLREDTEELEVRDYAVQHTEGWLQWRARETGELLVADADIREGAHKMLLEAAGRESESLSGTATSALVDLAEFHPEEFENEEIDQMIMGHLRNDGVHSTTRATAIQLAAERGIDQALPDVRDLVADREAAPAERLAGLGALGSLGELSDLQLLGSFVSKGSEDARYAVAAQRAIGRIVARNEVAEVK